MAVRVSPSGSSAVVVIADDLVGRYVAQGWRVVDAKKPVEAVVTVEPDDDSEPKRRGRPKKTEE